MNLETHEVIHRKTGGSSGTPLSVFWTKDWRYLAAAASVPVISRWTSSWLLEGNPGSGSIPSTAVACDNTTLGGMVLPSPGSGRTKYIEAVCGVVGGTHGSFVIYDRLLHSGGLSAAITTSQSVGGTITRNTGGIGNQIWLEVYSVLGSATANATVTYTNQDGVGGRTSVVSIGGSGANTNWREVHRSILCPLQTGDTGVRSVQSVQLDANTNTAGNFGVTIAKPLIQILLDSFSVAHTMTFGEWPMLDISQSCLSVMLAHGNATIPPHLGFVISTIEK